MDLRAATPAGFARYASGGRWKLAPHLALLNRVFMAAVAGEPWARKVVIQLPPRSGKTEFSRYALAWTMGTFPDRKIMAAGYSSGFAQTELGQPVRDLMEGYGKDVFGVRVRQDARARGVWRVHRHTGAMYALGMEGGGATGRGAHLLYIDDPVSGMTDALSQTVRDRTWRTYTANLATRLESVRSPQIVVQTRWHTDDLAGRLQREEPGEWLVISLPAIAEQDERIELPGQGVVWTREQGQPLWPYREALYASRQAQYGPDGYEWLSLYQQRPTPIGGGILKPETFRRFRYVEGGWLLDTAAGGVLVPATGTPVFAIMDLATSLRTSADYTVIGVFALAFPHLLLLDVIRGRMEGPDLPRVAAAVWQAYRPAYIGVEQAGFQLSTVQDMRRGAPWDTPPRPALPVKGITPDGDKVTRALTLASRMAGGHVYVPESAPWLPALEAEMTVFPRGDHDDQVDMLAYAAKEAMTFGDDALRVS